MALDPNQIRNLSPAQGTPPNTGDPLCVSIAGPGVQRPTLQDQLIAARRREQADFARDIDLVNRGLQIEAPTVGSNARSEVIAQGGTPLDVSALAMAGSQAGPACVTCGPSVSDLLRRGMLLPVDGGVGAGLVVLRGGVDVDRLGGGAPTCASCEGRESGLVANRESRVATDHDTWEFVGRFGSDVLSDTKEDDEDDKLIEEILKKFGIEPPSPGASPPRGGGASVPVDRMFVWAVLAILQAELIKRLQGDGVPGPRILDTVVRLLRRLKKLYGMDPEEPEPLDRDLLRQIGDAYANLILVFLRKIPLLDKLVSLVAIFDFLGNPDRTLEEIISKISEINTIRRDLDMIIELMEIHLGNMQRFGLDTPPSSGLTIEARQIVAFLRMLRRMLELLTTILMRLVALKSGKLGAEGIADSHRVIQHAEREFKELASKIRLGTKTTEK